ncbi:MAG TPA: hypothetical protein VNK23_10685 [Candidatus Dormibacteraeota bacterium]|nr:hypothetical protein [Candidatus Dormibacteraeota bacterium]
MRLNLKQFISVLAIFVFAMVVWATTRTESTRYDVTQAIKIGQTQLKPGHYTLKANESNDKLRVIHDGKLVATVPVRWVKLHQKATSSEIFSNRNHVTRVEFRGRKEAISVG